jgi:hypothetical protein
VTPTATASPSGAPTVPGSGPLQVLGLRGAPNPDPRAVAILLSGPADAAELRLWTPALVLIGSVRSGPLAAGWQQVPLPAGLLAAAPRGLCYATVRLERGAQRSAPVAPLRLFRLR